MIEPMIDNRVDNILSTKLYLHFSGDRCIMNTKIKQRELVSQAERKV